MPLASERRREIVVELVSRPGHEKVRALVYQLLVDGIGASSTELDFERRVPEVHGRIDALLGRTVFEFKSNLRREQRDAEEALTRYLGEREAQTGERFVGIATDGATFIPYELRHGSLRELPRFSPRPTASSEILAWLSAAVAVAADLTPTPEIVTRELGRQSLAWHVARQELGELWEQVAQRPNVRLKRELWARLLERVYGASVDNDDLFFQHTYLTIVAKTIATHVLGINMPAPSDLLAGRPFQEAGITGAVEADFFDWLLAAPGGDELVRRIALQAARFRLRDVAADVLKGLYESLVDPEQRHFLGEYYTPDWLAARICEHAIDRPLEQRVLDPACGSGTFLFHAIRRFLAAAEAAGLNNQEALARCTRQVLGVDIHPVAAQIARVTYLLAIGEQRLQHRPPLAIPVYLGDSLQWNTRAFMAEREVLIEVPDEPELLEFPFQVARDPSLFDAVIQRMLDLSRQGAPPEGLTTWLQQQHDLDEATATVLAGTYQRLRTLQAECRNHIWGFVARNLARPVWLSQQDERADVIVGNPPWLAFNFMSQKMQAPFKAECQRLGIWVGGRGITPHQDLSAYFFARCVELYLKPHGLIGFVMPYATMSRRPYEKFLTGRFATRRGRAVDAASATVYFTDAWALAEDVQPLFPVPSCVLFARPQTFEGRILPETILKAAGILPRRDASTAEAEVALSWQNALWPLTRNEDKRSPYHDAFRDGAILYPRLLCVVERVPVSLLGENPYAPLVQSRRTPQEKRPWKDLPALRGNVEARFLHPLYLGESVAPYRLLQPVLAVVPWEQQTNALLNAAAAQQAGFLHLAQWLGQVEQLWQLHGRGTRSFYEQLNYYGQLSAQLPPAALRVVYAASGTLPAAALLRDQTAVCEHALYWTAVDSMGEALYLCAILNSETLRSRIGGMQARGQWGARHFDKYVFEAPIPRFNPRISLHRDLASAAGRAEEIAAVTPLRDDGYFVRTRARIREALREGGVAQRIDELVARLLRS